MINKRLVATGMITIFVLHFPFLLYAGDNPWTPYDIWKLKGVGDPRISPCGKWIAYVVTSADFEEDTKNDDIWNTSRA